MASFIWTAGNVASATKHGVTVEEAEDAASHPLIRQQGTGGIVEVIGKAVGGRYIEVMYRLADPDAPIDWSEVDMLAMDDEQAILIFHARPLTDSEKRRLRRRLR